MVARWQDLKVKIFADGADIKSMLELAAKPYIHGFTTNPTLMHKAGVKDYPAFAKEVLKAIPDRPISFEVFSDDFPSMEREALEIASWGKNVYAKIPVRNTKDQFAGDLIRSLSHKGVKVNVTAIFELRDVVRTCDALRGGAPSNVSVFAGRVADTGVDPLPMMRASVALANTVSGCEVIWASPRELLNIIQADEMGCHIITVSPDILAKVPNIGKSVPEIALDAVKIFYKDAQAAGFKLF